MTVSKRFATAKSEKFHGNIHKRGMVPVKEEKSTLPVPAPVLAFFVFVVIGSSIFQIIRTATSPSPFNMPAPKQSWHPEGAGAERGGAGAG
eukprot:CAMPEP_0182855382 /NCGR_PEP_ID=MMETSP0034_2-20130328/1806_1 /TAXON_ID=156128 /ORGANISM="Nephroselmis pyriformis, Strain CCMP717" /LENGTH=90 /DNA_ID=CAMNT_0024986331 /DNA_START=23 /DNA_END=292 /DNA_ORIENTATION=+